MPLDRTKLIKDALVEGTTTSKALLASAGAVPNAVVLACTVMVPAAAVPVKKRVKDDEFVRDTAEKESPVSPTVTIRSSVEMPLLKSLPVIIKVGVLAPFATVEVVAIDFGVATVTVNELLAAAGATVNAEVLA